MLLFQKRVPEWNELTDKEMFTDINVHNKQKVVKQYGSPSTRCP